MKILALDLGKFKTVICLYHQNEAATDTHGFTTVDTLRPQFIELIREHNAESVFETRTAAGSPICATNSIRAVSLPILMRKRGRSVVESSGCDGSCFRVSLQPFGRMCRHQQRTGGHSTSSMDFTPDFRRGLRRNWGVILSLECYSVDTLWHEFNKLIREHNASRQAVPRWVA